MTSDRDLHDPPRDDTSASPAPSATPDAPPSTTTPALAPEVALQLADLDAALGKGHVDLLESVLADDSFDIDVRDAEGRTPLMMAAAHGVPAAVHLCLTAGADCSLTDHTGAARSVLVHAVTSSSPNRDEVVELLVAGGADVNQPCGRHLRTPLMHAAEADVYAEQLAPRGFASTTRVLIRLGAELEQTDRQGNTVWGLTKRNALGARTSSAYRRRMHQMLRVLEHAGAQPVASHLV